MGAKVPQERKFHGTKIIGTVTPKELSSTAASFPGTKVHSVLQNEKSMIRSRRLSVSSVSPIWSKLYFLKRTFLIWVSAAFRRVGDNASVVFAA